MRRDKIVTSMTLAWSRIWKYCWAKIFIAILKLYFCILFMSLCMCTHECYGEQATLGFRGKLTGAGTLYFVDLRMERRPPGLAVSSFTH